MASKKFGIDISRWQAGLDLEQAKKEGVEFVILKIGGGDSVCYKDSQFETFYNKCKQLGIPVGCYFFGQALTMDKAKTEAAYWIKLMEGHQFELPVYYDVEGKMLSQLGTRDLTNICKYVLSTVEAAGYYTGIYSSTSSFRSEVYDSELKGYTHWVAQWSAAEPSMEHPLWQFGGEKNFIRSNRIAGKVCDQDYLYVDFTTAIKKNGLNGFSKSGTTTPKKKTNTEIAKEVLEGKWGNAPERKVRLTEAGYNYSSIQTLVNKMVKEGK